MSFPRYPHYKESSVEWLGEVPGHWGVAALKRGFSVTLGKMLQPESINSDDELLPYLRAANIQWDGVETTDIKQMWMSKRDRSQLRLQRGDLLVSEGGDVGRSCLWASELENCYFQNSVNRVRARDGHSNRYLYYWISTVKDKGYIDALCNKSTIAHFTAEKVAAVPMPMPPLSEQTQIATFLDRETAKIDALMQEQRRLMELLKEKRQAVISHAVTKGLDPQAPMKPSGIEWLGDVPAHWDVSRIANVFREVSEAGEDELPILSVSIHHGVSDREMDDEEMDRKVTRSDDRSKYKRVARDDLVYNMMRAWQGGFGTVTVAGMVSPAYVVARPKTQVATAYIEHLLRTPKAIEQMRRHSRGVTDFRLRLYWDEFKNIGVPIPPPDEAIAICSRIAYMEIEFKALTSACDESINLLQERRSALISAAVTGQIDVRQTKDHA